MTATTLGPGDFRGVVLAKMWDHARGDVLARLARIDAGAEHASPAVVRTLRAFLAPDAR